MGVQWSPRQKAQVKALSAQECTWLVRSACLLHKTFIKSNAYATARQAGMQADETGFACIPQPVQSHKLKTLTWSTGMTARVDLIQDLKCRYKWLAWEPSSLEYWGAFLYTLGIVAFLIATCSAEITSCPRDVESNVVLVSTHNTASQ